MSFGTLPFTCDVIVRNPALYECPINVVILDKDRYQLSYELNGEKGQGSVFFDQEFVTDDFI
ncbi:MAG: hypothetical protein IPG07_03255 [Crocinitomicaceae bacterium]|nr:hypothetical protein [Crocinitomicaceae bacterium]